METHQLTAIIDPASTGYVALCPNLDIASEGKTPEEALANLHETLEMFFEVASPEEVSRRFRHAVSVIRHTVTGEEGERQP